jgi:ATP-dependent helicase/nuclease subunit B
LLEKFIREHKFVSDLRPILTYIEKSDKPHLQEWWNDLFQPIRDNQHLLETSHIELKNVTRMLLKIAQTIYPQIWHLSHNTKSIDFFSDLMESSYCVEFIAKGEFVDFLKNLLRRTSVKEVQKGHQINLISVENALYMNFDLVILADMNESSWPNLNSAEMLLTNQLRGDLNMPNYDSVLQEKIHDFYLNLCNKEVIITRSKKIAGSSTMSSKLLQKLIYIADDDSLKSFKSKEQYLQFLKYNLNLVSKAPEPKPFVVKHSNFPKSISATSVEMLIRNPYAFFARNILRLYQVKELTPESMSSEFGTLVHKIIALYNASLDKDFLNIAKQEFQDASIDEFITKLWWPKICILADEYNKFSMARSENIANLYSEIAGKMQLHYGDKKLQITAIADEIVIKKDGSVEILDYKTGAPPSAKDVLSGLSPQLVLEALIMHNAGFEGITGAQTDNVIFVKISSSKPHLSQTVISELDLPKHLEGLTKLLSYYATADSCYPVLPNKAYGPKYNDYRHLGRK